MPIVRSPGAVASPSNPPSPLVSYIPSDLARLLETDYSNVGCRLVIATSANKKGCDEHKRRRHHE